MSGYSGTPLAKKLGLREGSRVCLVAAPPDLLQLLAPLPADVVFVPAAGPGVAIVHVFSSSRAELAACLDAYRAALDPDATVWVSWPKKAAKVATDISEDVVRALALPLGFVDVKVCAIDATWSGLKLVVRKALR